MVTVSASLSNAAKDSEKIPTGKTTSSLTKNSFDPVSPTSTSSSRSTEEEVLALRARNKILTDALTAIKEKAAAEEKRSYDLVWYAKHRYRYPNHEASQRIDEEHKEDISKLRDQDGDYHHGFNSGLLAATRMFGEKADILHVNEFEELTPDLLEAGAVHSKKIEAARKTFPDVEVTKDGFPVAE